jgi:membrane fusion protein (multidrug efflux system)
MGSVMSGLSAGEKVIVEGLQRVRPGQPVSPGPASPQILATMKAASDDSTQMDGGSASQTKPAGTSK